MQTDRLGAIRHHLYAHGASSIQALSDAIGASTATVRRDLLVLEQQGAISRTHGGARIAHGSVAEVAFEVREKHNLASKRAIADAAYEMLAPHGSVFLDAGTTVLQLVRRLRMGPMPLNVFTNGLAVAQELMAVPKVKVTVIAGQLRAENASLVGPLAEACLRELWFDQLFLGVTAIGDDRRITSIDAAEASLNAMMQRRSAQTIVLADATKFDRKATYKVCDLASPLHLVTDDSLSADRCAALEAAGVTLTVARGLQSTEQCLVRGATA